MVLVLVVLSSFLSLSEKVCSIHIYTVRTRFKEKCFGVLTSRWSRTNQKGYKAMKGVYKGCVMNRLIVLLTIFGHIVTDFAFVIGWLFVYRYLQIVIDSLSPSSNERIIVAGLTVAFELSTGITLLVFIVMDLRRFLKLLVSSEK